MFWARFVLGPALSGPARREGGPAVTCSLDERTLRGTEHVRCCRGEPVGRRVGTLLNGRIHVSILWIIIIVIIVLAILGFFGRGRFTR